MAPNSVEKSPITLLGLDAMGTALARTWLAAGHPPTVWNRTARACAGWAHRLDARYLDGGIMAVPPMIGVPEAGGYVLSLAPLLADWLVAMAPAVYQTTEQLRSGDYTTGVVSRLGMQVAGTPTS